MPPLGTCCYQAVNWKGRDYLLTRLGFGLAFATKIMSAIVEKCVEKMPHVCSSYIDDIFVIDEKNCGKEIRSNLKKWDEKASEEINECITEIWKKLKYEGDPAKGQWTVNANSPINIWVDASSIALGVALEIDGDIVEDASWLRKQNDSQHINMSKLDAAIKEINMAVKWGRRKMTLFTNSATVNG